MLLEKKYIFLFKENMVSSDFGHFQPFFQRPFRSSGINVKGFFSKSKTPKALLTSIMSFDVQYSSAVADHPEAEEDLWRRDWA